MNAGPALDGEPATTAARAVAGAIVTTATSDPPSQRPSTICHVGAGDSQVKWNVPARTSAPSTASPTTSAAIGSISAKMPSAATLAKARSAGSSTVRASRPNSNAPAHGISTAAHRFGGMHDRQRVADDGGELRAPPADRQFRRHRTSSRNRLSSESSRARTSSSRIDDSRASRGSAVASSRACPVCTTRPPACDRTSRRRPSRARPARRRGRARRRRARTRAAGGRPSRRGSRGGHRRRRGGRGSARSPAAARRSTSLSTCELTITVRPSAAEALEQGDQLHPLHRVGAVQRLVEHEHARVGDQRRGDLAALAHALAEAVDPAVGDVEQGDGAQRRSSGASRAATPWRSAT